MSVGGGGMGGEKVCEGVHVGVCVLLEEGMCTSTYIIIYVEGMRVCTYVCLCAYIIHQSLTTDEYSKQMLYWMNFPRTSSETSDLCQT